MGSAVWKVGRDRRCGGVWFMCMVVWMDSRTSGCDRVREISENNDFHNRAEVKGW